MRNNFKRYIRLKVKENIYFIKSDSCLNPSFSFADVEKTLYLDFRKFYLEIYFHYILCILYNGNISKKRNLSDRRKV